MRLEVAAFLIDLFLLIGAYVSIRACGCVSRKIARLASQGGRLFDVLYPWHQLRTPEGRVWREYSVTEKLLVRWQFHKLRGYMWLWVAVGGALTIAQNGLSLSAVHAAAVVVVYAQRPR